MRDEMTKQTEGGNLADPIEDALRTFPLAEAPPALDEAVMRRVRALAPAPRFRLAWLDYALALFAAGLAGLAALLWLALPEVTTLRALNSAFVLAARLGPGIFGLMLLGALALAVLAVVGAGLLFERAGRQTRHG